MKHIKKLHQSLEENVSWYKKWHEVKNHKVVHYTVLLLAMVFAVSIIITSSQTFAAPTTYYVSTTGNNANPGTSALPWKTVAYACGNTSIMAGDTIYVNAGTYTEAQCSLRPGINLQGAGIDQTIIKSTAIGDWNWYLSLESNTPTNGNQTISGITFNGQWTSGTNGTWMGIWVARRSNVIIHDTKVINFYDRGVIFDGHGMINPLTDPGIYATGNKFYNNTILNSARMMGGTGAGLLNIGGQNGMEIYNNTLIQDQRANGYNGWPIKYWENGFLNGVKITNNILKKKNFVGDGQGNGDWDFAIELFNIKGLEIANNTIQGSIDLNYNYKGTYPYSVWIHDNVIDHSPANTKMESGIIFEFATQSALVERNIINNVSHAVLYNARQPQDSGGYNYPAPTGGYSALTDNVIRNNVFSNVYNPLCCGGGAGIQVWIEEMDGTTYMKNMNIYNNVFSVRPNSAPPIGFDFPQVYNGTVDGLFIRNNILKGFSDTWFEGNSGPKFKNTVITHNNAWQNGNNNQVRWIGGNPTVGYVNSNNLSVDPKFTSATDFHLLAGSPMIDAGFAPLALPSGVTAVPFSGSAPDIGYSETGGTPPPPDTTAPTVSSVSPTNGSTGVAVDSNVMATFSEALSPASVTPVTASIGGVTSTVTLNGSLVTINPNANLNASTTYTVTLMGGANGIKDLANPANALASNYTFTFTTAAPANIPPTANAGADQTIVLPTNSVSLSGSLSNDPDGNIVSYAWAKVSGSGTVSPANTVSTTVTGLTVGQSVYRLTVTDNQGATGTDTVTITVNAAPDTTPPTISITNPTSGVNVQQSQMITVNVSDNVGVDHVDYYRNPASGAPILLIGTRAAPPSHNFNWQTTSVPNGNYCLTAKAYDAANNSTVSTPVCVTVANPIEPGPDTIPPTVSWVSPVTGSTVGSSVTLSANASDNIGVGRVEFYRGTTWIGSDTSSSAGNYAITWDSSSVPNGTYTFTAKAFDGATPTPNTATSTPAVSITVNNSTSGTYATWNPNDKSARIALSNGNLTASRTGSGIGIVRANKSKSAGKWYWEVKLDTASDQFIGIAKSGHGLNRVLGSVAAGWSMVMDDGVKFHIGNQGFYGTAGSNGDVVGVALDMDAKTIKFYKKNVGQTNCTDLGIAFTGVSGPVFPAWGSQFLTTKGTANFGATPFACPVPAGYNAGVN